MNRDLEIVRALLRLLVAGDPPESTARRLRDGIERRHLDGPFDLRVSALLDAAVLVEEAAP